MCILSIAGHGDEIEGDLSGNASRKIGEKKHTALQDAHQMQRFIGKIPPDLPCHFLNAPLNPAAGNQDSDALFLCSGGSPPGFLRLGH
jgi:hypothetical protein